MGEGVAMNEQQLEEGGREGSRDRNLLIISEKEIHSIFSTKRREMAWDGGRGGVIAYLYIICTCVCMYVCRKFVYE